MNSTSPTAGTAPARAFVALTSIQWREAWKYGERAFRYCQLDVGHGLGTNPASASTGEGCASPTESCAAPV